MRPSETNPFPSTDPDRHAIWEMLVRRDIDAFLAGDWSAVEEDFEADAFLGIDGRFRGNPDSWQLAFPDLASYREAWLEQSASFRADGIAPTARDELFDATTLRDIEIRGDRALLHKKFDGSVHTGSGAVLPLVWQSLYHCRRKADGAWKITGFVGYLPFPMGMGQPAPGGPSKQVPADAAQHATAGPYSPVLEVKPGRLVVISGQAALAEDGSVVGETIEEQAAATLDNCARQLACAGCGFADVFKVNVFLPDLAEWSRFNEVYQRYLPEPRPVRTAVGTALLPGLKVEVEMWAVKGDA